MRDPLFERHVWEEDSYVADRLRPIPAAITLGLLCAFSWACIYAAVRLVVS